MKSFRLAAVSLLTLAGCWSQVEPPQADVSSAAAPSATPDADDRPPGRALTLTEARRGFKTKVNPPSGDRESVPDPPRGVFVKVAYDAPPGKLAAYLTPDPKDGKKHPAIVWITGGDCNSIGEVWGDAPASNDQTAAAYRKAGIVMMFPSLRGGNDNPGAREGFFGEVDDVTAAADYLARQEYVDPKRVYLGGHSTGGTLALLVAESTDRFRAVFSFGPVDDVAGYGPEYLPFDASNPKEIELRSPGHWLDSVRCPTFVFEGEKRPGNLESLQAMARSSTNPLLHFRSSVRANHFSILAPVNRLVARKVLADGDGPTTGITFNNNELDQAFGN